MTTTTCKLSPLALGLSLGILWGVTVFILGLTAYHYAYGNTFVDAMGTLYTGYAPTILGSFIGAVIGFIDAFIAGALLAWLYNLFACCCRKDRSCKTNNVVHPETD